MTSAQYRNAIEQLGFDNATSAARWLGIAPRTSQGYAAGDWPVPEPTAKLLRLVIRLGLEPSDVK